MSVLHQQRITVTFNSEGFFAPERPWEAFCPCCDLTRLAPPIEFFATWSEATGWVAEHLRQFHCRFCVDGQMPAGRCEYMGELFERCPCCLPPCRDCDGIAVYPALYDSPDDLVRELSTFGLGPIFCPGCTGVITLIALGHQEDLT